MANDPRLAISHTPNGWPVGSFRTYEQAQRAVDSLSDQEFPVQHLQIIGVDLVQVENVLGRLTWPKVLLSGAAGGAWVGLFFGLLFGILIPPSFFGPIMWGLIFGAIFGLIMAAVSYGMTGGRRDFTSSTQIVAGRYDVICTPEYATKARDMIASMGIVDPELPQSHQQANPYESKVDEG